jgi:sugar phosphate isomerase/epimerase
MKFGCSSLLFGSFDLDTAIAGLKQAGYEAIELCSIPGLGEHFRGGEDRAVYDGIRAKLDDAGLILESVGGSGSLGTDRFEPLMEAAAILGAPYLTLGSGGVADTERSWGESLALVRQALPVCERTGVKLSIKPHVRSAVYGIATARRVLDEIQSPWIGLNLDNTHLQRMGDDPIAGVHALRDSIFTARIRDFRSTDLSIGPLENQIPGKGSADVAGYLRALTDVPGLDIVTVEMVGTRDLLLTEVQRVVGEALVALRSYLA